jgi:hypothetical protein
LGGIQKLLLAENTNQVEPDQKSTKHKRGRIYFSRGMDEAANKNKIRPLFLCLAPNKSVPFFLYNVLSEIVH